MIRKKEKVKKSTMLIMALLIGVASFIWGLTFCAIGLVTAGLIPLACGVITIGNILTFVKQKQFMVFSLLQLSLILILPFMFQITLGGFNSSGGAIMWSVLGPLGALMFFGSNSSFKWFLAYIILLIASGLLNEFAHLFINGVPSQENPGLFVMNIAGVSMVTFIIQRYFVKKQEALRQIVREKNEKLTDSINYAKRIQDAQLPDLNVLDPILSDNMILFKPKDIVSGDFYWITKKENCLFMAAVDCTGHGVPGAFMSLIGTALLNEIVIEKGITDPGKVLDGLRANLITSLKQEQHERTSRDGMDMAFVRIDLESNSLAFAGAYNPLYLIHNRNIQIIKGDRQPVGVHPFNKQVPFKTHHLELENNDALYLFSDGITDQFGGANNKKFTAKRLQNALLEIVALPDVRAKRVAHHFLAKLAR